MNEKYLLGLPATLSWLGVAACLLVLAGAGSVRAQQQDWRTTLVPILEAHGADPDAPSIWYQIGITLSKAPGFKAPASVWLDGYLLAVPDAPNAAEVRTQIQQLRAASEPRTDKLIDRMEVMALEIRGAVHDRQGRRDMAIADFTRIVRLDPTHVRAKEALKRLSVAPEPREKLERQAPLAPTTREAFRERDLDGFACGKLWEVRNRIYKERGYCFKTSRAIEAFGNAGCRHNRAEDVPLNSVETANIALIVRVEAQKRCPR